MKKRILIIDSDAQLNKINEKVLSAAGLAKELRVMSNAADAISHLKTCIAENVPLPEVIVLEIDLPEMDGFQFVDQLRKLDFPGKPNIELVVFTNSSSPRARARAGMMGIRHFLNKPFLLRGLTDILHQLKSNGPEFSWQ